MGASATGNEAGCCCGTGGSVATTPLPLWLPVLPSAASGCCIPPCAAAAAATAAADAACSCKRIFSAATAALIAPALGGRGGFGASDVLWTGLNGQHHPGPQTFQVAETGAAPQLAPHATCPEGPQTSRGPGWIITSPSPSSSSLSSFP